MHQAVSFLFSLIIYFLVATSLQAQPDLKWGVVMSYEMLLSEVEDQPGMEYQYQTGRAAMFTPLYVPEVNRYAQAFLTHIEEMRTVKNFVGPLGTEHPTSLGYYLPHEALNKRDNGQLERVGRMFMPTDYNEKFTFDNGAILRNGKPLIVDGHIKHGKDTVYTEDLNSGELVPRVVEDEEVFFEAGIGGGFIEEWEYEKSKGQFNKDIKYLELLTTKFGDDGVYRGMKYFMTFKTGSFKKRNYNEEGLIRKNIEYYVLFNRDFSEPGEKEVSYGYARTSNAAGYMEPTDRYELLLEILSGVKDGQLSIYNYDPIDFDPEKLTKAENRAYFEALTVKDTSYVEDLQTGKMKQVVVDIDFKLEDVIGIRFFEDWYIDGKNMDMYKRVKGIVLLKEHRDAFTGEVRGVKPYAPFYIKLNPKM